MTSPKIINANLRTAAKKSGLTLEDYLQRKRSGLKRCWRCEEWLPVSEFCKDKSRCDGMSSKCKVCNKY